MNIDHFKVWFIVNKDEIEFTTKGDYMIVELHDKEQSLALKDTFDWTQAIFLEFQENKK